MNPNLSRRAAFALHALLAPASIQRRLDLSEALAAADSMAQLPRWARDLIERGEADAATRGWSVPQDGA